MALDRNQVLKPVKKLRKVVKKIDRQPSPETIHDLRTNTRRFEAMLEALALDPQDIGKPALKRLTRFRKRAGKVRDMDVLTSYASQVHVDGEDECAIQLLENLGMQRRKQAKRLYSVVQKHRPDVRSALKRAPAVVEKCIRKNGGRRSTEVQVPDAAGAAVKLTADLAEPQHLSRTNLHPYRLKVKELRNVLRMAAGESNAKFVDQLGEVKDAIGEWHDWEELSAIAKDTLDHGRRCRLLTELKHITDRKFEHALALTETFRKKYLSPRRKSARSSLPVPGEPAWRAIALLAG